MNELFKFEACPLCGVFDFVDQHKCPPAWLCRLAYPEDAPWRSIRAEDSSVAAERYAAWCGSLSTDVIPVQLVLVKDNAGEILAWRVFGISVPLYTSTPASVTHENTERAVCRA